MKGYIVIIILLILMWGGAFSLFTSISEDVYSGLPPRPTIQTTPTSTGDMPPRPTAQMTPTGMPSVAPSSVPLPTVTTMADLPLPPSGGLIILTAQANHQISGSLWTIVQWQDLEGRWHTVEGWQGAFNEQRQVIWWVAPEDLGKGPFRWVVYETSTGNEVLTVSGTFFLPVNSGESNLIEVLLP